MRDVKLNKEIVLSYSGGVDSLYAAYILAKKYDKVHLLTIKLPQFILINTTKKSSEDLKRILGRKKIIHKIINAGHLFKSLNKGILKDTKKYKHLQVIDINCKLSMYINLIIYCLENNIYFSADGTTRRHDKILMPEERPSYIKEIKNLYKEYFIMHSNPSYYVDKNKLKSANDDKKLKVKILENAGFKVSNFKFFEDLGFSCRTLKQPLCLIVLFEYPLFLKLKVKLMATNNAISCFNFKKKFVREHIRRYFESKNVDLDKLLKKREEVYNKIKKYTRLYFSNESYQRLISTKEYLN